MRLLPAFKTLMFLFLFGLPTHWLKAQCTATITPGGSTSFCSGGSVSLSASGPGGVWAAKTNVPGSSFGTMTANGFSIGSKGYVALGFNGQTYNTVWEFDPSNNTWTQKASFPAAFRQYPVVFGIGTKGYLGLGEYNKVNYKDFWEFNPTANTWTQKTDFPGAGRRASGFSIGSKGYAGPGYGPIDGNSGTFYKDFYEYDPSTNAWTQKTDFGGSGRFGAATFTGNGKGYVGTGFVSGNVLSNDLWEYNPTTNAWTQKANFAGGARYWTVSFGIGSKGYIGTGYSNTGTLLKDFWEYDIAGDVWIQKTDFGGTARRLATGFSIGSKGYIGTGLDASAYKSDFYEYTPSSLSYSWSTGATSSSISVSSSGSYTVNVSDAVSGCNTTSAAIVVTVTPNLAVGAASSSPTVCINSPLTNITHSTTGATGIGSATNLPAGVTASFASNTITISGTPTASGTFSYSIPLTGTCGAANATGTITVTPAKTVSAASSAPAVCINTTLPSVTFSTTGVTGIGAATGLPSGVTASFASNTITISGTPSASGTFSYSIPTTGGCGTANATGTITVTPANTMGAASSAPTLCINTALTPITRATTGVTGIGAATGLPTGVTASFASNTITISGTPSASGTFSYSIPTTGGCGTINATGTITVTPANTMGAASSAPSLCINTALTPITRTTTGVTGIGAATGLPSGVTASFASNTITISGTPSASGTFSYSIPTTGGCGTLNATGSITVTANVDAGTVSGVSPLCKGATATYTHAGAASGTWSSNDVTIATVNASTGLVTAVNSGTTFIKYTVGSGCGSPAVAQQAVTVKNTFTIAASATGGGTISPSGNNILCEGADITFDITSNSCYPITDVVVDGQSQGPITSYTFSNVSADHTISATFVQNTFDITVTAGANGSITPGTGSGNCGGNATYNITPDACYSIADVVVDGVSQGAINSYTFINVSAAHTISATFVLNTYDITVTAGANGSITPGTGSVNCGDNPTYAIAPDACYSIADVVVDGVSQGAINSYTFTNVAAAHTIIATFVLNTYDITVTAGVNGSITPGTGSVNCGDNATYTIAPDAGFIVSDVVADGISQGALSSFTFSNVNTNHTISAIFSCVPTASDTTATACNSFTWNGSTYKASGDYVWHTINEAGCDSARTLHLTIVSVSSTTAKTDALCANAANGTLTVTPTSGVSPYTYKIGTTGSYVSANTFTGLRAGNYRVSILDANGCAGTSDQVTILQPAALTATNSKTDAVCYGSATGAIETTPTSGIAPFSYKLGTSGTYGTSNTFSNLKAGNYTVYILDANTCPGTATAVVGQSPLITGTSTSTPVLCNGGATGSITVTPTNGTAPHTYRYGSSGAYVSSNVFTNVKGGSPRVYIKDANGCEGSVVANVSQPDKMVATATIVNESCPNAKNGSVTINPTGGTSPYSYRFGSSGAFGSSNTFSNLKAGSYRVYVNDANGCSGYSIATVVGQTSPTCVISTFARGVVNSTVSEGITLSPNPTNNQFKLMLPTADKPATVRIMDVNGKTLYTTKTASQPITFGENFAPGIYMVEVRQGNELKLLKAVKVR